MDFEELWLLEAVIGAHPPWSGWIPFWALPDDDPDETSGSFGNHAQLNFPAHHFSLETLVDALSRLFANGEIVATHLGYRRSQASRLFVPTRDQIVSGLTRGTKQPWLCYTLTEKGMRWWEEYADPNWNFHRQQTGVRGFGGDAGLVSTVAASVDVAQRWIEYLHDSDRIHWERATYQFVRPWKVYPFKTLPSGVHVLVPTSRKDAGEASTDACSWEVWRERLLGEIDPWYRRGVRTWKKDQDPRESSR